MEYKVAYIDCYFDVKLMGKATVKDSAVYLEYLTSHELWRPGSLVLSDETDLELGHLTADDLKQISSVCGKMKAAIGSARFGAVVPKDLIFGMNRMFQVYVEPFWNAQIYAFRTRDEALKWLLSK